jgi:hypothetical protein
MLIITQLLPGAKYPKPCWAICTSATRVYATSALNMAGVPIPDVFVAAEDVTRGKPLYYFPSRILPLTDNICRRPDPYLLGAKKCDVKPERCPFYSKFLSTSFKLLIRPPPRPCHRRCAIRCPQRSRSRLQDASCAYVPLA